MYSPQPTVCINEVQQPDSIVVNNITIQSGRTGVNEQPRAAYSTISLVSKDGLPVEADLNQCVRVNVLDSNGNETTLFRGFITDISNAIVSHGVLGYVVQTTLTAVSALAKLSRFLTNDLYPKQFDGDRVYDILVNSILTSWDEWDALQTWAEVNPALTWNTVDPENFVETIERPGDYELTAYSGGAVSASSLSDAVANSVRGVLYETPDGFMNYDSALGRQRRVVANGFLQIEANYISGAGLTVGKSLGDVVNFIEVIYKNDQTVSVTDSASELSFGKQGAQLQTQLENEGDAETIAQFLLDTRSQSRSALEQFQIPLHNPNLDDATRNALLGVFCGFPVEVSGLPSWIGGGVFTGFVEGLRWDLAEKTAVLSAYVSEFELSAVPQSWGNVDASIVWNDVDLDLVWATAKIVG